VLRELLTRTEQITDLRELFRVLGYQAAWETVPPGPWLGEAEASAAGVTAAALIARHKAFRVLALSATGPERAARLAAKRLAAGAERGLICALDAPSRRLSIAAWRATAAGTLGIRSAAVLLTRPSAAAIATIERLAVRPDDSPPGSSPPSAPPSIASPSSSFSRVPGASGVIWHSPRSPGCYSSISYRRKAGSTEIGATSPGCSTAPWPGAGTFTGRCSTHSASAH
jgi:hypothetical protein